MIFSIRVEGSRLLWSDSDEPWSLVGDEFAFELISEEDLKLIKNGKGGSSIGWINKRAKESKEG